MRIPSATNEKMMSAYQLLQEETINVSTFEHIRTIVKGIHPEVDKKLEICSQALSKLQKIQSGDVITLSAEGLPEETEKQKKRKKALLFFISSLKNLQNEMKRVDAELTQANKNDGPSIQNQLTAWGRIIKFAKGPFGVVTLIAIVVVGFSLLQGHKTQNSSVSTRDLISPSVVSNNKSKIQVIVFNGKQIPLTQFYIGHGPDCLDINNPTPHYHAKNGSVTALDGTVIRDPEGCGFGKVKDVQVVEVEVTVSPSP